METHVVVRVWLPDRPGALGLVASRIGATGADIVGIDVLERSEHVAVDEFAVVLGDEDLVSLLIREVEEVDGVSVEEWRIVDRFPDPRIDALESAARICSASALDDLANRLVSSVQREFDADWAVLLQSDTLLAGAGTGMPSAPVLQALATGTSASPAVAAGEAGPDDLAIAPLTAQDALLLVGRDGHPFRTRERGQLMALARVADRVAGLLS